MLNSSQRKALRTEQLEGFDPNGIAVGEGVYGLPFTEASAEVIMLPVPWEVTVSYNSGTADGPEAIRQASRQVDLMDPLAPKSWELGLWMSPSDDALKRTSDAMRQEAERHIEDLEAGRHDAARLARINAACEDMVKHVRHRTGEVLDRGQKLILIGGDHSTPLGYIQALAERGDLGILHIDAHMDLREAYEGFTYSHASVMWNALKLKPVSALVQVGIRDYAQSEWDKAAAQGERVHVFWDRDLKHAQYRGANWASQVDEIVSALPQRVYVSWDIDGLDPRFCPNTGTPVAGGFTPDEILYLLEQVKSSGREFVGMDLNEVAPGEHGDWDANVAARLLYRMATLLGS